MKTVMVLAALLIVVTWTNALSQAKAGTAAYKIASVSTTGKVV